MLKMPIDFSSFIIYKKRERKTEKESEWAVLKQLNLIISHFCVWVSAINVMLTMRKFYTK